MINVFRSGDRVALSDEMLSYPQNARWIGKRGTVVRGGFEGYIIVKWDHLNGPMDQPADFLKNITVLQNGGFRK